MAAFGACYNLDSEEDYTSDDDEIESDDSQILPGPSKKPKVGISDFYGLIQESVFSSV